MGQNTGGCGLRRAGTLNKPDEAKKIDTWRGFYTMACKAGLFANQIMRITMRILPTLATGFALAAFSATVSLAQEAKMYAVPSNANYCPAGLQPVTIDGSICCGVPNQDVSYRQVMRHPTRVTKHRSYSARVNCAIGDKGCSRG